MASQIIFFAKNKLDISNENAVLTASQGNTYVDYVRNRSNDSAWITTDSLDVDLTSIEVDFVDSRTLDFVLLIQHNFKAYTIQYWNGSSYVNFSTPISQTVNTETTTFHQFTEVETSKIKLIVQGTMVANSDKYLFQFIASTMIGQLNNFPVIQDPTFDRNISKVSMLSGKSTINENIGGYSVTLAKKNWKDADDLAIVEALYDANEGFLFWPCGGNESQFQSSRKGYRKRDIYLMKCANDFRPMFADGIPEWGMDIIIKLVEVTE